MTTSIQVVLTTYLHLINYLELITDKAVKVTSAIKLSISIFYFTDTDVKKERRQPKVVKHNCRK